MEEMICQKAMDVQALLPTDITSLVSNGLLLGTRLHHCGTLCNRQTCGDNDLVTFTELSWLHHSSWYMANSTSTTSTA